MKRNLLYLFLFFNLLITTSAQTKMILGAKQLPQHDMSKWHVPGANYSGITNLQPDRMAGDTICYAVVSDKMKESGFYVFKIVQNRWTGDIENISVQKKVNGSTLHSVENNNSSSILDAEGIAFVPSKSQVFISYENDQSIRGFDLHGAGLGTSFYVPQSMGINAIYPNYGFEAFTYDQSTNTFWATTEHTLMNDGKMSEFNNISPCLLRLQQFDGNGLPIKQIAYMTDAPEAKSNPRNYAFGVSALTALEDGSILVLEREFFVKPNYLGSWVRNRIYRIHPKESKDISSLETLYKLPREEYSKKEFVAQFKTTLSLVKQNLANYEGMCLGAKMIDGRRTLILISDSQDNYGNNLYKMKDYIKVICLEYL